MPTYDYNKLINRLQADEGFRLKPYIDTAGKVTIGVGRNLTDVGISNDEALYLLHADVTRAEEVLDGVLPLWRNLDDVRQRVLLNMAFNLGLGELMFFRHFVAAVQSNNYEAASNEMLNSQWAGEVGERALRLAMMMKTGVDP